MAEIKIRNISDDTLLKLKMIASKKGISLSELGKIILTQFSLAPELDLINAKYETFANRIISLYKKDHQELIEVVKSITEKE